MTNEQNPKRRKGQYNRERYLQKKVKDGVIKGQQAEDIQGEGVPLITEQTYNQLVTTYNFNTVSPDDANRAGLIFVNSPEDNPYFRGINIAQELLSMFPDTKTGLLQYLEDWLKKNFSMHQGAPFLRDSATVGFAYILKAFQLQFGAAFLDRLSDMPSQQLMNAFDQPEPSFQQQITIMGKARSKVIIPSYQMFLNSGIAQLMPPSPCDPCLETGALKAYNVIERVWDHVKPQTSGHG